MFKAVETDSSISKEDYKELEVALRFKLLEMQRKLDTDGKRLLIIISGVESAGKGALINKFNEWMDVRKIQTHVFKNQDENLELRPEKWKFWQALPPKGQIGIFFGSWYSNPITQKLRGQINESEFQVELNQIRFLETMLSNSDMVIVKFWLHLSKKDQKKRLKKLESDKQTKMRVTKADWRRYAEYDTYMRTAETMIRNTDSGISPWHLIDCSDSHFRDIKAGEILLESANITSNAVLSQDNITTTSSLIESKSILDKVEFSSVIDKEAYKKEYKENANALYPLCWDMNKEKKSTVIVFEGWDAAGKGGAIRRVTQHLDAKLYRVIQTAAPTDEEKAHHYLWRFWRHIPEDGRITIYDRSWYGRVLVERVEGFASQQEWKRSYLEINNFEEELVNHGTEVIKFWVHISKEEQLRRFKEREETPHKRYKITDEDWRNREKWDAYEDAVQEMILKTDTEIAPWKIIPGNYKKIARLHVIKEIRKLFEHALK